MECETQIILYSIIGSVVLTCIIFGLFWVQQEYYWRKWAERERERDDG